jgi:hypothetical protein
MPKLCVCGNARSGSSSLHFFLRDLNLNTIGEPFHQKHWKLRPFIPGNETCPQIEEEAMKLYAEHDCMKHLWCHLKPPINLRLCEWMVSMDIQVIHLERDDKLSQAISFLLAIATSKWGKPDDLDAYLVQCAKTQLDIRRLRIEIDAIVSHEARYLDVLDRGRLLALKHSQLYGVPEETVSETVEQIVTFTGLDRTAGQIAKARKWLEPSRKQMTQDVFSAIGNIEEIEQAFAVSLR